MGDRCVWRPLPTQIRQHGEMRLTFMPRTALGALAWALVYKNRLPVGLLCVDVTVTRNDTLPDIRTGLLRRADKRYSCASSSNVPKTRSRCGSKLNFWMMLGFAGQHGAPISALHKSIGGVLSPTTPSFSWLCSRKQVVGVAGKSNGLRSWSVAGGIDVACWTVEFYSQGIS
jgi:hypothetical protein